MGKPRFQTPPQRLRSLHLVRSDKWQTVRCHMRSSSWRHTCFPMWVDRELRVPFVRKSWWIIMKAGGFGSFCVFLCRFMAWFLCLLFTLALSLHGKWDDGWLKKQHLHQRSHAQWWTAIHPLFIWSLTFIWLQSLGLTLKRGRLFCSNSRVLTRIVGSIFKNFVGQVASLNDFMLSSVRSTLFYKYPSGQSYARIWLLVRHYQLLFTSMHCCMNHQISNHGPLNNQIL